jgi:hypothetical protein
LEMHLNPNRFGRSTNFSLSSIDRIRNEFKSWLTLAGK